MDEETKPSFVIRCDGPSCSRTNVPHMCGRCHNAYYCSVACQRKDWTEGKHRESCRKFDSLLAEALHRVPSSDGRGRLPRETDKCLGQNCHGGATLEFPFFFAACGQHWVCADCVLRAAVADPDRMSCPQCGAQVVQSASQEPVGVDELACEHLSAAAWYLRDPRLTQDEKASVAKRVLASHALVKEGYFEAARNEEVRRAPLYTDIEVSMRSSIMLAGNDPGALEEARKGIAGIHAMLIGGCDLGLSYTGWEGCSEESIRALKEIKRGLQETGVTCKLLHDHPPPPTIIGERAIDVVASSRLVEADALAKSERWDEALEVYQDLVYSSQKSEARMGVAKCHAQLRQMQEAEAAAALAVKSDGGGIEAGAHKVLAEIQQATGKLPEARRTMERALVHETPWDERNLETNVKFLRELTTVPKAERERRLREKAFAEVWTDALALVRSVRASGLVSWSSIKLKEYDMFAEEGADDDENERLRADTASRLDSAVSAAIRAEDEDIIFIDPDIEDDNCIIDRVGIKTFVDLDSVPSLVFDRYKLTKEVRKWWTQGDNKYKDFFVRRLRQLAAGDRSRILRKRLTGSKKTTIFETYLEQKSGFRILWTEAADDSDDRSGIIIWYVSPHDLVSRYMRRIDEAETRSIRQLTAVSALPDLMSAVTLENVDADGETGKDLRHDEVKLDPFADTPLKLYALRYDDLNRMAASTWLPPLYLTTEERKIVETEETVLLLGRSGTGKTVCICNRIDFDRHLADGDPTFSQLFVARSQRICNSVADTIGSFGALDDNGSSLTSYMTFRKLLVDCEERLSDTMNDSNFSFEQASRIDYAKFRAFMASFDCALEPLIVWTQIRSFIKGSIEAVKKNRPLTLEEYLDTSVIGSRRCRLITEQREAAYAVFVQYEKYRTNRNLWDDCDRVGALVKRLCVDRAARERVARRRVYVDEIQDYSQVEIALFFLMCDSGGLFLAGDPAQSVVEGVEFRFEEVRSVAYHLYSSDSNAHRYIPKKPLSVTRNFRSHAGILNVAAEVLDKMFVAFPGSAKELPKDEGLFRGPRPTVFQGMGHGLILDLISKVQGVVLLSMHDDHVDELKRMEKVKEHGTVVLSIRDAKGLEFPDVILVDFFKLLPPEQQKPWRLLLQGKTSEASRLAGFPEVETQLKQLYTAITRCSRRLFFVETATSDAGQAFLRFLCAEKKLAVKQEVEDVQESVKAVDEWATTGVQYATNAEASETDEVSLYWLDKALFCFQQGKVKDLERKAQAHLESIRLRMEYAKWERSRAEDDDDLERSVAQHFTKLASEGLLREASEFFSAVSSLLPDFSREALTARLVPLLPERDEL